MRLLISREVERVAIRKSHVLILRIVDLTSSCWYLTVFCPVDIQYVQIACQGFLHMFFSTFSAPSRSWRKRRMRSRRIEQQSSRAVDSSHVPMLSQPERAIDVIRTAATAIQGAAAVAHRALGMGNWLHQPWLSGWIVMSPAEQLLRRPLPQCG